MHPRSISKRTDRRTDGVTAVRNTCWGTVYST